MSKLPKFGTRDRYCFVQMPQCPKCGSTNRKSYRTTTVDGSKAQHSECRDCGHRFIVVFEILEGDRSLLETAKPA